MGIPYRTKKKNYIYPYRKIVFKFLENFKWVLNILRGAGSMSTIIIGTLVVGSMIYVAFRKIQSARKGESSCGCGCNGCSKSKSCHGITIDK